MTTKHTEQSERAAMAEFLLNEFSDPNCECENCILLRRAAALLAVPEAAKPDAFDPQNNCEKNHRECEAPELCGKYGHCMGA